MKYFLAIGLVCCLLYSGCVEREKQNVHQQEAASLGEREISSGPQFIHSVYFWLKKDVGEEEKVEFLEGLEGLRQIASVRNMKVGLPAGTPRDIVDNSYSVAMIIYFDDQAGHDAYQDDSLHTSLIEASRELIERVQVYDLMGE